MVRLWVPLVDTETEVFETLCKGCKLTAVEVSEKMGASTPYMVQKIRKALCSLEKSGRIQCRFRTAEGRGRPSREYWLPDAD